METFCTTARHPKYRATLNANSFYQASTYSRNFRQNEYGFANSTRNLALLWHERPPPQTVKSKGKFCSIALAAAAFVVLVTVLSIAGLALYMGALRTVTTNPLVSYSCSAKVTRGDRFASNLQEKGRKYRIQFESLYQRSVLGPSVVSCAVEKFGNDSLTIYFKITLNRRKIPRHIYNIEKSIKDILLSDALNRKPAFRNVRFDARSISIKQVVDAEPYQRVVTKSKEPPKPTRPGVLLKPPTTIKSNATKKPTVQEPNIKEEDLPVIQGSFKISKTDADITEKKISVDLNSPRLNISITTTTIAPKPVTLKDSSITSALFKLSVVDKSSKPTTTTQATTSTTLPQTTTITTTTALTTELTTSPTTVDTMEKIINPPISPTTFNQAPWVPIYQNHPDEPVQMSTEEIPIVLEQQPIYTSFTNPGLSFHALDTEKLGSTSVQGHPLPVNKIADMTEPSTRPVKLSPQPTLESRHDEPDLYDLSTSDQNFTEVKTLQHVPIDPVTIKNNWQPVQIEGDDQRLKQTTALKNISSIFHSLASSLGIPAIHFNDLRKNYTTTNLPFITDTPTLINNREEKDDFRANQSEPVVGQGQAEVIDADEVSLLMQTTKEPLVTLLPVKSNSGVGRPVRPRPKPPNENISENRSFPSDSPNMNLNDYSGVKYVETEVVTSVSSEQNRVKLSKNDYNVVGVLNFETQILNIEAATPAAQVQTTLPEYKYSDEVAVLSVNSSTSTHKEDGFQYLSQEKLKQLSEISKLSDNSTVLDDGMISTKAVSSSYTINHAGFNILTKTFNKVPNSFRDEDKKAVGSYNSIYFSVSNKSECSNFTVKCGDGQCLPDTTRCNQLVDCNDGSDEKDCNCADYLRSQFLLRKICDGVVDCWDFSDENHCDWCSPGQYVCGNSKVCIDRTSICDGVRDCPHGDDERQCVTVAPTITAADEFPYHSEGYLLVRKHGNWGKLCVENFENVVAKSQIAWEISDLGQAVCKAMTYQALDNVKTVTEQSYYKNLQFYELAYSFQNETKSSLTFKSTTCASGAVVKVKCQALECGARPQATKQIARIVGGGNAGLGAWPWQAALYKEGEFQCGATLISDRWLLSAGHCFYHSLKDHWVARLGALRRGTALPSPYEQLRPIVDIILHKGYVDAGFINDISLLRMQVPVTFSDYVRPICLPPAGLAPRDGRMCTVIGWGQLFEIGRIFPDTLQEVQVPIISTAECRKRTLFLPLYRVTDDMFCAGYERGGRDACLGDSGGPLMCPEPDGRWVLHGITSNGYGCARAYRPGVYTKVANYVNWINSHVENEANSTVPIKDTCTGHRCPLGECLPKSSLCNGFIECSDGSDEVGCLQD